MRSIISKKDTNKRKQIALGVVLVVVMFFSVLSYSFQGGSNSNSEKIIYNGFEFLNQNGFWFLELGDYTFSFSYNPNEVEKINLELNYLDSYSGKPLYIYSEDTTSGAEVYQNLFYNNRIVQRMQPACLENQENCDENSPVKTCSENFIIIKEGNETEITQNENCVFIKGKKEDLVKLTDEFLFKILNID